MLKNRKPLPTAGLIVTPRSAEAVDAYMNKWAQETNDRINQGDPFVLVYGEFPVEILIAMDIPHIEFVGPTPALYPDILVPEKGHKYRQALPSEGNYDLLGRCGRCRGVAPEIGKMPTPTAIVRLEEGCTGVEKATYVWSRTFNVPIFTLENTISMPCYPRYARWWERIIDQWDEVIETYRLDYRVEELKALIKFLERTTGKTLRKTRLAEVLEEVNEGAYYWRKTRDLVAKTTPYPIGMTDVINMYPVWQMRGAPGVKEVIRTFYNEVRERVDNGEALYPKEKLRMQWVKSTMYGTPAFYRSWEEKYGAVFGTFWNITISGEGYARSIHNNDPLRAIAGMKLFLGIYCTPEWEIKEAKLHKVNGAVMHSYQLGLANCIQHEAGTSRTLHKIAFEAAGIPMLLLDPALDMEQAKAEVSNFIEKRLLT